MSQPIIVIARKTSQMPTDNMMARKKRPRFPSIWTNRNTRRTKCFDIVAICASLAVGGSLSGLFVARAPSSGEITQERTDPESDANDLIRMLMHGLVGRLGAIDRLLANAAIDFLTTF